MVTKGPFRLPYKLQNCPTSAIWQNQVDQKYTKIDGFVRQSKPAPSYRLPNNGQNQVTEDKDAAHTKPVEVVTSDGKYTR